MWEDASCGYVCHYNFWGGGVRGLGVGLVGKGLGLGERLGIKILEKNPSPPPLPYLSSLVLGGGKGWSAVVGWRCGVFIEKCLKQRKC